MSRRVILTGLRANNDLTIGNYFGAILPMIDMAQSQAIDYQINLFVPDLHSFTTPIDHQMLQEQIWQNIRLFVAAGLPLDNPNIHIYRQSYIPAHSELTWILDCFTGFGEMSRMTQFKDKSAKLGDDRVSVGLFNYPVLMTADVLLYNAEYIPVGEDQTQHLEFIRDIAERLNNRFGEIFTVPQPVVAQYKFFTNYTGMQTGLRIRDLQNPLKKMSKSEDSDKGVIFLQDDPQKAAKKIMSATTDSAGSIQYDADNQPGITNLLQILALATGRDQNEVNKEWVGKSNYGNLKESTAEAISILLEGLQSKLSELDDAAIKLKLDSSEATMSIQANETLLKVQKSIGLR